MIKLKSLIKELVDEEVAKSSASGLIGNVVNKLLGKYVGGEKYFDHFDAVVRDPNYHIIVDELRRIAKGIPNTLIIVSGKFGKMYSERFSNDNAIVIQGGIRVGNEVNDLSSMHDQINGKNFVFIDDSFYSGKTRDKIKDELERHGAKLIKTVVAYDGSKNEDPSVISLYRYYNK